METKLGPITKGEAMVSNGSYSISVAVIKPNQTTVAALCNDPIILRHANEANAALYADAHNTALKCNRLPSELLEERDAARKDRDELVEMLWKAKHRIDRCSERMEKIQHETGIPSDISLMANSSVVFHIDTLLSRYPNP